MVQYDRDGLCTKCRLPGSGFVSDGVCECVDAHPDFVTVTHGMRGYFAVLLSWDEELGFYAPYTSGFGSYATPSEAYPEGRQWAEAEEVEFREVDEAEMIAGVARSEALAARIRELRTSGMSVHDAWRRARKEFRA